MTLRPILFGIVFALHIGGIQHSSRVRIRNEFSNLVPIRIYIQETTRLNAEFRTP